MNYEPFIALLEEQLEDLDTLELENMVYFIEKTRDEAKDIRDD